MLTFKCPKCGSEGRWLAGERGQWRPCIWRRACATCGSPVQAVNPVFAGVLCGFCVAVLVAAGRWRGSVSAWPTQAMGALGCVMVALVTVESLRRPRVAREQRPLSKEARYWTRIAVLTLSLLWACSLLYPLGMWAYDTHVLRVTEGLPAREAVPLLLRSEQHLMFLMHLWLATPAVLGIAAIFAWVMRRKAMKRPERDESA